MKAFLRQLLTKSRTKLVRQHNSRPHKPVLLEEAISYLSPQKGHKIIDMTFGAGGHTERILQENDTTVVYCLDRDPTACAMAKQLSERYPNRVIPLKASRGFSISKNGPLDMRMNPEEQTITAADVLAKADQSDLYKIFKVYGEEKQSKKIANAVIEARYLFKPLKTTRDFCELVQNVCDNEMRSDMLHRPSHPATKVFQALRIFVNNELNEINHSIVLANHYLKMGGVMVTVAFHSLEDTIVKRHIQGNVNENMANTLPLKYINPMQAYDKEFLDVVNDSCWHQIHKHVITPSVEEVESNPRSRSARLRAAVRIK
ncbi:hypothetical protein QTP88_023143 [Uroleucon formosanum]